MLASFTQSQPVFQATGSTFQYIEAHPAYSQPAYSQEPVPRYAPALPAPSYNAPSQPHISSDYSSQATPHAWGSNFTAESSWMDGSRWRDPSQQPQNSGMWSTGTIATCVTNPPLVPISYPQTQEGVQAQPMAYIAPAPFAPPLQYPAYQAAHMHRPELSIQPILDQPSHWEGHQAQAASAPPLQHSFASANDPFSTPYRSHAYQASTSSTVSHASLLSPEYEVSLDFPDHD